MTARTRDHAVPQLEDFPYRLSDNVRFADLDPNNHVNNAVYASYFESARVTLIRGLVPDGMSWVLARLDIHFRSELHWPGTIELGIGLVKLGRTSTHYDQAVFSNGVCVASARAITVLVDLHSRKPTPLTGELIEKLKPWWRRGYAQDQS